MKVDLSGKVTVNGVDFAFEKVVESDDEKVIAKEVWRMVLGLNASICTELNVGDYKKEQANA